MRDRRRRGVLAAFREQHFDLVRGEHFERARHGRLRERVRVHTQEQRSVDRVSLPVQADRLRDRENVALVEGRAKRRPAVPRRAEDDALLGNVGVRPRHVIAGHEPGNVDQDRGVGRLAGQGTEIHGCPAAAAPSRPTRGFTTTCTGIRASTEESLPFEVNEERKGPAVSLPTIRGAIPPAR